MLLNEKNIKNVIKVFYSPVIISIVLGIIMFFTQIRIPSIPSQALEFAASLNTPLAMIVSGVTIADTNIPKLLKKFGIYYIPFLKLILIPAIVTVVFALFNIDSSVRLTIIIASAAPSAAMYAHTPTTQRANARSAAKRQLFFTRTISLKVTSLKQTAQRDFTTDIPTTLMLPAMKSFLTKNCTVN